MKSVLFTTAATMFFGTTALTACAQDTPYEEQAPVVQSEQIEPAITEFAEEQVASDETATADWIGQPVFDQQGNEVAIITSIVLAEDGSEQVVLSVSANLGLGEKVILVPANALTPVESGKGYITTMTAEEMEQAPPFVSEAEQDI